VSPDDPGPLFFFPLSRKNFLSFPLPSFPLSLIFFFPYCIKTKTNGGRFALHAYLFPPFGGPFFFFFPFSPPFPFPFRIDRPRRR